MSSKKIALLLLLTVPAVLAGQSSQESRRKKAVKVYTDEDLARVRAKAEQEAGESTDIVLPESSAEPAPAPPSDFERERTREVEKERAADKEAEWDGIRASYQARYDGVKEDLARIRAAQAECLKNAQYIMAYPAMDDCSGYPPQVKAKQKEMEKIESDLLDEARRRSVFPGKARIQK